MADIWSIHSGVDTKPEGWMQRIGRVWVLAVGFIFALHACSVAWSDSLRPHGLEPDRLLRPWYSPGKTTGVGSHALLQGIFLTQGSNPHLLHCKRILYHWATGKTLSFAFLRSFRWFLHGQAAHRQHLPEILTEWFLDVICRQYICKAVGANKMSLPSLRKMGGKLNSSARDTKINNREEEKYFTSLSS